jgi:LPXTG-site transpeptidase (sortase) family protein
MATKKVKKANKITSTKSIYFRLGIVGVVLVLVSGGYLFYHQAILSFSAVPKFTLKYSANTPVSIYFPAIQQKISLIEGQIRNGIWQIDNNHALHLSISGNPGQGNNIIIYGHNTNRIFGLIHLVKIKDYIQITTQNEQVYNYIVTNILTVSPNQIDLIDPTNHELLTVYTCTGMFDSQRLVIQAKPFNLLFNQ